MGKKLTRLVAAPVNIGVANAEGTALDYVRRDHVHNHPSGLGFDLHHAHYARILWSEGDTDEGLTDAQAVTLVCYAPIQIPYTVTLDALGLINLDVAAGSCYLALYSSAGEQPTQRLAVTALTAKSGTNRKQLIAIPDTSIAGGLYFVAYINNSALDRILRITNLAPMIQPANITNGLNWYEETLGAFGSPPAVATPIFTINGNWQACKHFVRVKSVP